MLLKPYSGYFSDKSLFVFSVLSGSEKNSLLFILWK